MIRIIRTYDPWILSFALAATFLGLIFIFDAGYARALKTDHNSLPPEFKSQLLFLVAAAITTILTSAIRVEFFRKWSKLVWLVNIGALVAVMIFGQRLNSATRWFGIGQFTIQPGEFAKLAVVIYLAGYFAHRKAWPDNIKPQPTWVLTVDNIWIPKLKRIMPAVWVLCAAVLVEVEPDLGTAAVIAVTGFAMFLPGGVSRKSLVAAVLIAILGAGLATIKEPYRVQRFLDHPNRWTTRNIDDTEYQTVQAELAIASGGAKGVGLGIGRGKQVLPATTTDFIMATVGEETGLWGSLGVLLVLGGLVFRLFYLAKRAPTQFGMLVLYGVGMWIGVQTCVNMMMANAFLPAIGIPIPFISSGGSSLVALWMAIGVCQAALRPEPVKEPAPVVAGNQELKDNWARGGRSVPVLSTNYRGRLL